MNAGAKLARYETLLFLHADTILPQNALKYINEVLINTNIKAGAFDLSFNKKSFLLNTIAIAASFRSRVTSLPYGDQAIFIKKNIFKKLDGYEDFFLMEDVNLMQKLKKNNFKIEIIKQKVITSSRKWDNSGIIYTTFRNWILLGLYFLGVSPNKLAKFYK